MRISERLRDRRIWKWMTGIVVLVILLAILAIYWPTEEKSTPRFLQSRGLHWEIVVEDPIPIDEVQATVTVLNEQIRDLFEINSYKVVYRPIPDDGIEKYAPEFTGHSRYPAPEKGAITVPLYFVTGFRSDGALGWSWQNPQYFEDLDELSFKIVVPTQMENPKYLYGGFDTLPILLHEFGHLMGLKDLYPGGDVEGCSGLRVLMTDNLYESMHSHYVLFGPYILDGEMLINRTAWIRPFGSGTEPEVMFGVEEVYLQNNTIYLNSYDITMDKDLNVKAHYRPSIQAFDLGGLRSWWTIEEAAFIGMNGDFGFSCPQEFR